jgi:hypothetical protein
LDLTVPSYLNPDKCFIASFIFANLLSGFLLIRLNGND